MSIFERAKERILEFREARKRQPIIIEESDGPFRYEYVSVSHVLGAKLSKDSPDPVHIMQFPGSNATAYFTNEWDRELIHVDRARAIGTLLLTGLVGIHRYRKLSRYANRVLQWIFGSEWVFERNLGRETTKARDERNTKPTGCALVYRAQDQLNLPLNLRVSRRFKEIGVVMDAFDKSVIREQHKMNIRNVETATSIALADTNGSPEVRFLADDVHLLSKNDLTIYCRTSKVGSPGVVLTTLLSEDALASMEAYIRALIADTKLSSAASLFALSQHKSNDNLRSFIACWSALELLIFDLEKQHRDDFQKLLQSGTAQLPAWDKDLSVTAIEDYRLRDRFYAVACVINPTEAEADIQKFNALNSKRNAYYHRLQGDDSELPTTDIQSLFRKYLRILLAD